MELQFTGIGAAYYPILGSNCAFFTHKDHLYLIDCGESTFRAMFARNEIYQYEKITVLITHLHADHIGSLGSFLSYCKNVLHKEVTLVAQERTVVSVLSQCGVGPDMYRFTTDFSSCGEFGLEIEPIPVVHASDMRCCGFLFKFNNEAVYYSADTCMIPEHILKGFFDGTISTMYQECTFLNTDSHAHCSLHKLSDWIPRTERSRVYCMHLGEDIQENIVAAGFRIPNVV